MEDCLYCGDAAGRKTATHKDFTDTDRKFAINLGVKFYTPEMLFQNKKETLPELDFNPAVDIKREGSLIKGENINNISEILPKGKVLAILIGSAGSGKSTFVMNHLKGFERVNRDTLKTREKCLKVAEGHANEGKNIAIDNTNPTKEDRKAYLDIGKKHGYKCVAFFFELTKDLAMHLDNQREFNSHHKHLSKRVGRIPIHTFFKNVELPTANEGFELIKTVQFIAGPFDNEEDKEAFFKFTKGK